MQKPLIAIVSVMMSVLIGCSSTPKGVFSEGDMEDILYDYYQAKAMGTNLPISEQYKASLYIQSVFRKYNTTEADFDSSLVWYTSHPDVFLRVYKKVDERLSDELKNKMSGNNLLSSNLTAMQGDTTELWNAPQFCLLSNAQFTHKMSFYLPADTSFRSDDRYAWSFNAHIAGTSDGNMTAALCVRYENDSIASTTQNIYSSGPVTLILAPTSILKPKAVYGFIYKDGDVLESQSSIVLIDHFSLLRQHRQLPQINDKSSVKQP